MNPLAAQHCSPQSAPLDDTRVAAELALLPGWAQVSAAKGRAIEKTFRFGNFHDTMAFVNALAYIAHREDHHPDLQLSYGYCTVRYSTHSAGGITLNDFICAARIEALSA